LNCNTIFVLFYNKNIFLHYFSTDIDENRQRYRQAEEVTTTHGQPADYASYVRRTGVIVKKVPYYCTAGGFMKHFSHIVLFAAVLGTACTAGIFSENSAAPYGNKAAAQDSELSIEDMLRYALEDEYTAHAEYTAVLAEFGTVRPFDSILKAEETHIAAVKRTCNTYHIYCTARRGGCICSRSC